MRQRRMCLDASGLGEIDLLVGERDLELAIAGQDQRQAHGECAPLTGLAFQMNVAAQELGELADDREAKPRTLVLSSQYVFTLAGQLGLAEFLEDRFAVFLGNADAGVLDLNDHESSLCAGAHRDAAPFWRELDRVGEQ